MQKKGCLEWGVGNYDNIEQQLYVIVTTTTTALTQRMKKQPGAAAQAHNVFLISSLSSLKESTEELQRWAADSETAQPQQHNVQGFYRER